MRHHKTADAPKTSGSVIHWARWYDLLGTIISLGHDRKIRKKLLELATLAPGVKLLDVGCGTGAVTLAAKSNAVEIEAHGIDASPEMIEVANEKAAKERLDIDFQVALIEAIPFPNASFDLVTSSLMLHHLPDDLKSKGFAEIRRVLKPGGRFIATDFAAESRLGLDSPIGHILSILGILRGANIVDKLRPMLLEAGFSEVDDIPTRHKNFAFIRAR